MTLTRTQLEAIRDSGDLLPHGFMGFGKVCSAELAVQLLAVMDELETLKASKAAEEIGL